MLLAIVWAIFVAPCGGERAPPKLPDGWTHVEEEGIDGVRGAYHDRVSGLFVRTDTDRWGESVEPWAPSIARDGNRSVSERRVGRYVLAETAVPERTTCRDRVFTFRCDVRGKGSWNLSAHTCSSLEDERLDALIAALADSDWPVFSVARPFDPTQLNGLKSLHWLDVHHRLGRGRLTEKGEAGGLRFRTTEAR